MADWVDNELSFAAKPARLAEIEAWLESWNTHGIGGDLVIEDTGPDPEYAEWHLYEASFITKYAPSEQEWMDELRAAFPDDLDI